MALMVVNPILPPSALKESHKVTMTILNQNQFMSMKKRTKRTTLD